VSLRLAGKHVKTILHPPSARNTTGDELLALAGIRLLRLACSVAIVGVMPSAGVVAVEQGPPQTLKRSGECFPAGG
jgi:hypothetical protein